jgi:hydrogenase-4 component E
VKTWLDASLVIAILTMLMTLSSGRIVFCVRLIAVQGMALSVLPLVTSEHVGWHVWLLAVGTFVVKGSVLPWLLFRARRHADVALEVDPYVGFGASILAGVLMLAASLHLGTHLPLPQTPPSPLAVPVSFFALFSGLFLIVSRRKAIMQVLGYLAMENGIYVFGITFARQQPLLVEMGVLLDLIVGIFVMGIAIFHISREFDHIDADRLQLLKDIGSGKELAA